MKRVTDAFRRSFTDPAGQSHVETARALRRGQIVVIVTPVGGLRVEPGAAWFYPLGFVQAGLWATGRLLSGPVRLGRATSETPPHRPVLMPATIRAVLGAVFLVGTLIVREVPPLRDSVADVLDYAQGGSLVAATMVTVANGVAEETFFRGALFAAVEGRHPVLVTTLVYAATTVATGNPMLVFAAIKLGPILGLQRRSIIRSPAHVRSSRP